MDLFLYFRSVLEQDRNEVVLCNLDHTILYMNPVAKERYAERGCVNLVGKSLLDCHPPQAKAMIEKVVSWFQESESHNLIYTCRSDVDNLDIYMVALRDEAGKLIGYYEKYEYRDPETMELHDFKP